MGSKTQLGMCLNLRLRLLSAEERGHQDMVPAPQEPAVPACSHQQTVGSVLIWIMNSEPKDQVNKMCLKYYLIQTSVTGITQVRNGSST